ncbi:MAG TPA: hypothetical protein VGF97_12150 [Rhizomicrobium sp.]
MFRNATPCRPTGKSSASCRTLLMAAVSAAALSCLSTAPASASCTGDTWSKNGDGNWFGGGGWSGGDPNSGSTDVCITDGTSTVDLNGSATVGDLTIGNGNALDFDLGVSLFVSGAEIDNSGNLVIAAGSGNNTALGLNNNVLLTGGGTVILANNGLTGGGNAIIRQQINGLTLTNDETIEGTGIIGNSGLTLVNNDTIDADASGLQLLLDAGGGVTNTSLLEATGGGVLQISTTVDNLGGNIDANAGTVSITGTIQGGALNQSNSGVLQTSGTATLDGRSVVEGAVTITGTYTGDVGTTTDILGTIDNLGTVQLKGGDGSNSTLGLQSDVELTGGGTIVMAYSGTGSGNAIIRQQSNGLTLTNDETIEGSGIIGNSGLTLINNGLIDANDITGRTLVLDGTGNITNNSDLRAENGGVLLINNTINGSGDIFANTGSAVQLQNATINGGTLAGLGTLETVGSATLNDVTISAISTYTVGDGTQTNLLNTITNEGRILATGGGGSNAVLGLNSNVSLTGGGVVQLAYTGTDSGAAIIRQEFNGLTLTNVDDTIEGTGTIGNSGLTFINDGTVLANALGQTLTIDGSGNVTNNGVFEVAEGSELHLLNGGFTNFAGSTLTGGTYDVFGATGMAGTLQIDQLGSTGGEIVNNDATILLDGLSSNLVDAGAKDALSKFDNNKSGGSFTITNGRNFTSPGAFANAGTVKVGTNSTFSAGSGASLEAYAQSAGNTLVDGALVATNVSINGGELQGSGSLGTNAIETDLFNYGIVRPGDSGTTGTLTVNGNFTQGANGTLEIDIAGVGQNSQLDVTGHTMLNNSTLAVELLGTFQLAEGDKFDILNTDPFSDDFNHFSLDGVGCTSGGTDIWNCSNLASGLFLTEEFLDDGNQLWLEVNGPVQQGVPEPDSLAVLGAALGALAMAAWMRRKNERV